MVVTTEDDRGAGRGNRSATFLLYLQNMPRWVLLVILVALLVGGLAISGVGGSVLLLILAGLLGWLALISWPALDVPGRVLRIAVLLILVAFALGRLAT